MLAIAAAAVLHEVKVTVGCCHRRVLSPQLLDAPRAAHETELFRQSVRQLTVMCVLARGILASSDEALITMTAPGYTATFLKYSQKVWKLLAIRRLQVLKVPTLFVSTS